MAQRQRQSKNNNSKFDYKGYVSNLGKVGMFYESSRNSKGIEGTLVSIAENGVYAKVKGSMFPRLYARADFNTGGTFKCSCGKTFKITEVNGKSTARGSNGNNSKGRDNKGNNNNGGGRNQGISISDTFGKFGKNGGKKAGALIALLNEANKLDQHNDDDYAELVEFGKDFAETFK